MEELLWTFRSSVCEVIILVKDSMRLQMYSYLLIMNLLKYYRCFCILYVDYSTQYMIGVIVALKLKVDVL